MFTSVSDAVQRYCETQSLQDEEAEAVRTDAVTYVSEKFAAGAFNFKSLVTDLQGPLVSSDELQRSAGMGLLNSIFQTVGARTAQEPWLSEQNFRSTTSFLCERLQDFDCASPTLDALLCVLQCHEVFIANHGVAVANHFCRIVHVPQLVQELRSVCFKILHTVLSALSVAHARSKPREALLTPVHTADLADLLVRSAQGEKDPRCLVVVWSCCDHVLRLHPQAHAVKKIFTILAAYYPVSFNPRPNDPFDISKEFLVGKLRTVLCGHEALSKSTIELLVTTFASTNVAVKVDVLQSLSHCCQHMGVSALGGELQALSEMILRDIKSNDDRVLVREALATVRVFSGSVSMCTEANGGTDWRLFAQPLVSHCRMVFENAARPDGDSLELLPSASTDVDSVQGNIACDIILSLAGASWFAFSQVMTEVFELIVGCTKGRTTTAPLRLFVRLLEEAVAFDVQLYDVNEHPLGRFKESMLGLFLSVLSPSTEESSEAVPNLERQRLALSGVAVWLHRRVRHLLSDDEVEQSIGQIAKFLTSAATVPSLRDHVLSLSRQVIQQGNSADIDALKRLCVQPLLELIERNEPVNSADTGTADWVLLGLTTVGSFPQFFSTVAVGILLAIIDQPAIHGGRVQFRADQHSVKLMKALATMLSGASEELALEWIDLPLGSRTWCVAELILRSFLNADEASCEFSEDFLSQCKLILRHAGRSRSGSRKDADENRVRIVQEASRLFLSGNESTEALKTCHPASPARRLTAMRMLLQVVSAQNTYGRLENEQCTLFLEALQSMMVNSMQVEKPLAHTSTATTTTELSTFLESLILCYAELVNKSELTEKLSSMTGNFAKSLEDCAFGRNAAGTSARRDSVVMLAWITKALVMRGAAQAKSLSTSLCELLAAPDPGVARAAVRGLAIVLGDRSCAFEKSNGAKVSLFFRQRFFSYSFPLVKAQLDTGAAATAKLAVVTLARYLPLDVLLRDKEEIFPLLETSVRDTDDPEILPMVVEILHSIVKRDIATARPMFAAIVPALVQSASHGRTVRVRILALDCLVSFASDSTKDSKKAILRGIKPTLDDEVRAVRRFGSLCSNKWSAL